MTTHLREALSHSALGKTGSATRGYDPSLLFAIERNLGRSELGLHPDAPLPFEGTDVWTAFELSWLDAGGKPCAGMAEIRVPADSPRLVESKSLKLYLNGFNAERLTHADSLRARVVEDLGQATGGTVSMRMEMLDAPSPVVDVPAPADCVSLDTLEIAFDDRDYAPPAADKLLCGNEPAVEESLASSAFRSNCPVTGQPDFARVWIRYRGAPIDRAGLLRYLVSYREHAALHEQCVEKIFCDIAARCAPQALAVAARFTRRGGIDINPCRATPGYRVDWPTRDLRQ